MSKPENTFIASVHRLLPKTTYREKMANPYRGGTPDVWYSGPQGDLWIEYKFLPKIPPTVECTKLLSALQLDWINSRMAEGRRVWVVVGCTEGGVVFTGGRWMDPLERTLWPQWVKTRQQIASLISRTCTGQSL